MKIAVLGGAFNPPHLGHKLIAQEILKYLEIDEVWLTPCYHHAFDKKIAPVVHRQNMTKMLTNPRIQYCNAEIDHQLSGQTIELMPILHQEYPQHNFTFLMGSDNLAHFKKWGQWEKLITTYPFIIYPRPGFTTNLKKYGLKNSKYKFEVLNNPLLGTCNISSTDIRQKIKTALPIDNLVPEKVIEYIKVHHLYANH